VLRCLVSVCALLPLMASASVAGGRQSPELLPSQAIPPSAPPVKASPNPSPRDPSDTYACLKTEAKAALARGVAKDPNYMDDPTRCYDDIENYVEQACLGGAANSATMPYAMAAASEALSDWDKAHPEKQAEREAAKAREESARAMVWTQQQAELKTEVDSLSTEYARCLRDESVLLARASAEPAETLVKAAFAACLEQRTKITEAYRRHGSPFDGDGVMGAFDQKTADTLILNIIRERTNPPAEPSQPAAAPPEPKPHEIPL